MNLSDYFSIPENSPSAAKTSNELDGGTASLERLLNLGLGAYAGVNQLKNERQQADINLARDNRTAPLPETKTVGFKLTPQIAAIGAAVLVGVIYFATRK